MIVKRYRVVQVVVSLIPGGEKGRAGDISPGAGENIDANVIELVILVEADLDGGVCLVLHRSMC